MGVRKHHQVNWGRSYGVQASAEVNVEFVNVRMPRSHDLTLYLGDPGQMFNFPSVNTFTIDVGNGGTAWQLKLIASNRGTVVHVIAQSLLVRGTAFAGLFAPPGTTTMRFQAQAALGRPSTVELEPYNPGTVSDLVNPAAAPTVMPLSPWTTKARVVPLKVNPADPVPAGNIYEVTRTPLGDTLGDPLPLADWAELRSLYPFTNALAIENTGATAFRFQMFESRMM